MTIELKEFIDGILGNKSELIIIRISFDFLKGPFFIPNAGMIHIHHTKNLIIGNFTDDQVIFLKHCLSVPAVADEIDPLFQIIREGCC